VGGAGRRWAERSRRGKEPASCHQVPDNMRSLGIAFYLSVSGVSSFLGSFLITIVERVTKRRGNEGWLGNDLNRSKLAYYYWLLAILNMTETMENSWLQSRYNSMEFSEFVISYPLCTENNGVVLSIFISAGL